MLQLRSPWLCLVLACSFGTLASLTAVPGNDLVSSLTLVVTPGLYREAVDCVC